MLQSPILCIKLVCLAYLQYLLVNNNENDLKEQRLNIAGGVLEFSIGLYFVD